MTEEKRNRLIAAVTVNVILLIAILAVVCIYQIVEMVTLSKLGKSIEEQIASQKADTTRIEKTLEYYKSEQGLEDKAYEYGYTYGR